ncbi:hypothetical protein BJY01DRAFT_251142 [Aspergillus pseudoustus]|uniref:Uncharacterized protein n=1 Tax=Aspergillus pseudoustus TaxID=1810923 RepID=A0ABR4JGC0_9EURO
MAHQAHNIPWTLLASNLKYSPPSPSNVTNLYPRMQPHQGKVITFFINAFARNIKEHSICERWKYPEHYDRPASTATIVDEKTVARIAPTVRRVKKILEGNAGCRELDENYTASLFLTAYYYTPCYSFLNSQSQGFFNLQIVETLLLYGEMDTILRGCAHPDVAIKGWWNAQECPCGGYEVGWELIYRKALTAYLCLNLLYCFPELWDSASSTGAEKNDYRDTRLYQYMLRSCTGDHGKTDLMTLPHREFLGIPDDYWNSRAFFVKNEAYWLSASPHTDKYGFANEDPGLYGLAPFAQFLSLERPTALDIMELAEYKAKRRLKVEHDPLHPENREELGKYLKFCWQILVRCDMMAGEIGLEIPWYDLIAECLVKMLNYKGCKLEGRWFRKQQHEDYTWTYIFL